MGFRPCPETRPLPPLREAEQPLPPPENLQAAPLICRLPLKGGVMYEGAAPAGRVFSRVRCVALRGRCLTLSGAPVRPFGQDGGSNPPHVFHLSRKRRLLRDYQAFEAGMRRSVFGPQDQAFTRTLLRAPTAPTATFPRYSTDNHGIPAPTVIYKLFHGPLIHPKAAWRFPP